MSKEQEILQELRRRQDPKAVIVGHEACLQELAHQLAQLKDNIQIYDVLDLVAENPNPELHLDSYKGGKLRECPYIMKLRKRLGG